MDALRIENNLSTFLDKVFEHTGVIEGLAEVIAMAEPVVILASQQADELTRFVPLATTLRITRRLVISILSDPRIISSRSPVRPHLNLQPAPQLSFLLLVPPTTTNRRHVHTSTPHPILKMDRFKAGTERLKGIDMDRIKKRIPGQGAPKSPSSSSESTSTLGSVVRSLIHRSCCAYSDVKASVNIPR